MRRIAVLSLAIALVASAPPAVADDDENALRDPGFELGLPLEQGGWETLGASFLVPDQARTGKMSLFLGALGFDGSVAIQSRPARAGSQWRLTGYGLIPEPLEGAGFPPLPFALIQFTFFDAAGNDLGTLETAGNEFPALTSEFIVEGSPTNEWIFLDTGIGTAPKGTATISVFALFIGSGDVANFQFAFFDDLNLCAIDEIDDDEIECKEFDDDDDDEDDDDDDD